MTINTKDLNHNDMRPRFDDETYERILQEADRLAVKPNVYLRMIVKKTLSMPDQERREMLFKIY